MPDLPSPARAAIKFGRANFLGADRGHVRESNDTPIDSRLRHFAGWLDAVGFDQQSAQRISSDLAIDLIGAYITEVKFGKSLPSTSKGPLGEQSLRNYIIAAAQCLDLLMTAPCIIIDPKTANQKHVHLHPYLREIISQRKAWSVPRPKKEPFTIDMFRSLAEYLRSSPDVLATFLRREYAVYDWTRLGIFTGSRVAEYAQTRLKKGIRYNVIPTSDDAGIWAGQALAFLRDDFIFYDTNHTLIEHSQLHRQHLQGDVQSVHIRFRFDKSPRNFSIRKFQSTKDVILDPVAAAISILHRADLLSVPLWEPIGVFGTAPKKFSFLRDFHISSIMKKACVWAYPDETHYMRVHIDQIVPHSNRITAAVSLKLGGATDEEIAFRLRWHVSSVPTYLRECFQQVGAIVQSTLMGAYRTSL